MPLARTAARRRSPTSAPSRASMARVYVLGGRTFAPTEHLTGRQDGYLIEQTQALGTASIIKKYGELSDTDVARMLIVEAYRTGKFYAVIAGRLVEDGKKWNPKDAETNADFFADLSDPEEKAQLLAAFV